MKYINKKINPRLFFLYNLSILLLLNIILVDLKTTKNIRKLNNYYSEIRLVIQGNGTQTFIDQIEPSEVLINGISQGDTCKKSCILDGDTNNITLIFTNTIKSCYRMFGFYNNIIEIDVSKFDFSEVTNIMSMFYHCTKLEKIIFGNINTSSVQSMRSTFNECTKITSIDL